MHTKNKILFLTKYERNGASSRYRSLQYIPYLESQGLNCIVSPLFDDTYLTRLYTSKQRSSIDLLTALTRRFKALLTLHQFNLLVIEKELIPYTPAWLEQLLNAFSIPYVVDYDDAIFHQYDQHQNSLIRRILGSKIASVMRHAQLVIAGNQYLANYAHQAGAKAVEVIPTVIDLTKYPQQKVINQDQFTIGWIGSPSTFQYVEDLIPTLATVCANGQAKVLLIGVNQIPKHSDWLESRPWSEANEVAYLQECDVGIMPLPDSPWERGKCGLKLIQYMACHLPVIASPVGVNTEIVEPGKNGYLASTQEEWINALTLLRNDKQLRLQMGREGRKKVETHYCLQVTAPRLAHLFQQLIEDRKKP